MNTASSFSSLASLPPLWAKLGPPDPPFRYHPLIGHLLDVAAVTETIWDRGLPETVRAALGEALGLSGPEARSWVVFLAALHDIGKLSPCFQLRPEAGPLRGAIVDWGQCANPSVSARHGIITTLALRELLVAHFGIPSSAARELAAVAGGHHGTLPRPADLQIDPRVMGSRVWHEARAAVVETVADLLDLRSSPPSAVSPTKLLPLAALISVADWIGSDERLFPYACTTGHPNGPDGRAYLREARTMATHGLGDPLWFDWGTSAPPLSFQRLFPKIETARPLQQHAIEIGRHLIGGQPELVIIEAPMGEGKTEAALYLAHRFAAASGRAGFYFALPTQATSNQMFSRALDYLRQHENSGPLEVQLLHGHASLSAELEFLTSRRPDVGPTGVAVDEGDGPQLRAATWFSQRKRGLLAPFGIGTVDQAMLAALRSRHVFVRLFGLLRRVVIVDEVHAYDTYMSSVLERLLEWLAALGSPVILLSATLPTTRRSALADAYARGLGGPGTHVELEAGYPVVTRVLRHHEGVRSCSTTIETSGITRRRLKIGWLPNDQTEAGLADWLANRLGAGGCAAVVCNTVARAQSVFKALRDRWPTPTTEDPSVELLHARFPYADRYRREKAVVGAYGLGGQRPSRSVLVATQMIEQSLDVDFDLMVSDMAPADLLLQRSGRVHRHERVRPARCSEPALYLTGVTLSRVGVPVFDPGTEAVYDRHVLLRSWLALRGRTEVAIPEDVQALVDEVYRDTADPGTEVSDAIRQDAADAWLRFNKERDQEASQAAARYIKSPFADARSWDFASDPYEDDDDPSVHGSLKALTRLAPPSVTIVCLFGEPDAPRLQPGGPPVDLELAPADGAVRDLLERSLSVQWPGLVRQLLSAPVPQGWRKSPSLRYCRPLVFSDDGVAVVPGHRLQLHAELGLVIERESRNGC